MLHTEIAEAIKLFEWQAWGPIVWNKGRPQPGNFASPYAVQGEMLWLLYRPGEAPINHEGNARDSILRFTPVSVPATAGWQTHAFEKPAELMRHLVRKHTSPGNLVFDACGCTGVLSEVAIELKRHSIYAESHAANYQIGSERISAALAKAAASPTSNGPIISHMRVEREVLLPERTSVVAV